MHLRKQMPVGLLILCLIVISVNVYARAGSEGDAVQTGAVLVLLGLGGVIWGFHTLQRKQLIENTPTSKIRSIAMGPVEVFGTIVGKNIFKSWLSQQDCAYCKVSVEEERKSKRSTYWVEVFKKEQGERFYLQDDTGQVLVDPAKAEIDVGKSFSEYSGAGKAFSANVQAFLQANGVNQKALFGFISKKMRVTEWSLKPQQKMYILGYAGDNPEVTEGTAVEGHKDVMVQFKQGQTYLISDKNEKQLIKGMDSWKLFIVGGIIAFGIGLFLLYITFSAVK